MICIIFEDMQMCDNVTDVFARKKKYNTGTDVTNIAE